MRFIFIFSFLFCCKSLFSQSVKSFFGQAQFKSTDKDLILSIETGIRKNQTIKVIRIDASNGQVFILTKEQENFTKQDFLKLFGQHVEKVSCLFIGVYGKDKTQEFPFSDCE
jgi:hypothetical protein